MADEMVDNLARSRRRMMRGRAMSVRLPRAARRTGGTAPRGNHRPFQGKGENGDHRQLLSHRGRRGELLRRRALGTRKQPIRVRIHDHPPEYRHGRPRNSGPATGSSPTPTHGCRKCEVKASSGSSPALLLEKGSSTRAPRSSRRRSAVCTAATGCSRMTAASSTPRYPRSACPCRTSCIEDAGIDRRRS